jgi:hypothetical protein
MWLLIDHILAGERQCDGKAVYRLSEEEDLCPCVFVVS